MNQEYWPPSQYRLDIWEGERWNWGYNRKFGDCDPEPGDRIVFFYAPTGGDDPGIYGWAIILRHVEEEGENRIYYRPVAPSDQLKMNPWWDDEASQLVDEIRGKVKRGTLWLVDPKIGRQLLSGISNWVARVILKSNRPIFDEVWKRIISYEGEKFITKNRESFTYQIRSNHLVPSRTDYNIGKTEIQKAYKKVPFKGPVVINKLVRGPSYVWAVLNDPRISQGQW